MRGTWALVLALVSLALIVVLLATMAEDPAAGRVRMPGLLGYDRWVVTQFEILGAIPGLQATEMAIY